LCGEGRREEKGGGGGGRFTTDKYFHQKYSQRLELQVNIETEGILCKQKR
jgi:hypothetical protein